MVYAITIHKPAEDQSSPMVRFNLHFLSDSTGETLEIVANPDLPAVISLNNICMASSSDKAIGSKPL